MGIVVQGGTFNPQSIIAPNVVVQILPPSSAAINGVPSNILGAVGSAVWGPKNIPVIVGSMQEYIQNFGQPISRNHDMGTAIYAATLNGAVNMRCVRVTDGTDTAATVMITDNGGTPIASLLLTAIYTGSRGNVLNVQITNGSKANSYRVIIGFQNSIPEIFDNITGSGITLWENIVNAINMGISGLRGPSNLVVATLIEGLSAITVTNSGTNYTEIPAVVLSGGGGLGATAVAKMKALTATPVTAQAGIGSYAPGDLITLAETTAAPQPQLTVQTTKVVSATIADAGSGGSDGSQTVTGTTGTGTKFEADVTITGGAITSVDSISLAGDYTVNPTDIEEEPVTGAGLVDAKLNLKMGVLTAIVTTAGSISTLATAPVSQGSTSGSGTGVTFNLTYGIESINITARGTNYSTPPSVSFTGGGGGSNAAATATIGPSSNPPALSNYILSGGTDGANLISANLIGVDSSPRTGMYALRGQQCSIAFLTDLTDTSTYSVQSSFALSEGVEMLLIGAPGQTLAQAASAKNGAGIDNYDVKFLVGDWCYIFDPYNNTTRLISPQGFAGGRGVNLLPNASTLNKQIVGIVGTQTTQSGAGYTSADIAFACDNGLDVIYNPSPGGNYFALQTGQNTSSDPSQRMDSYTRLTNYLAYSIAAGLGNYIGELQSPTVRESAKSTLTDFFMNLFDQEMIGDVNYPNDASKDFRITLDASNNPDARVEEGYMQADIQVVDYAVIRVFLINLQNGQVSLASSSPVN